MLGGSVSRAIKGLTLTSANDDNAISILQERHGKTQQTIAAHMHGRNLKTPSMQYWSQQSTAICPRQDHRSCTCYGIYSDFSEQYGSMPIPIIMLKIPHEIRLVIARKNTAKV